METIGLIAAMSQESDALLRCIGKREPTRLGPFRCFRFQFSDHNCLLVTSGMGLQRAAQATQALLEAINPHFLVSFGIAGAVHEDLQIGDVVVAWKTCLLEKGVPGHFWPLAALSEAAWEATAQALQPRGARLVHGTAITTRGSQVILQQTQELPNPVLEMETAGIAQVAAGKRIPLLSLRAVSDGPRAPIPFDLAALMDEEANLRIGKLIRMILRQPRILLQSRQMLQNSRKAAQNAAIALVAALSQPSPVISP
jgi:adenosylhomocysteine nucleosidase